MWHGDNVRLAYVSGQKSSGNYTVVFHFRLSASISEPYLGQKRKAEIRQLLSLPAILVGPWRGKWKVDNEARLRRSLPLPACCEEAAEER